MRMSNSTLCADWFQPASLNLFGYASQLEVGVIVDVFKRKRAVLWAFGFFLENGLMLVKQWAGSKTIPKNIFRVDISLLESLNS